MVMSITKVAIAAREHCSVESKVCFRRCWPQCRQKGHETVAGARLALQNAQKLR